MAGDIYVHYGHDKFEKERFMPIVNRKMMDKPRGGLWASNVKSKNAWKQWCTENEFHLDRLSKSFKFKLDKSAKIVELTHMEDLQRLTSQKPDKDYCQILDQEEMWVIPDFEQMAKDGVDAVQLNLSWGDYELYYKLYGWDCDSILVMNPDIINPI